MRALVANRLAATPARWCALFARFNSGTNNNQWMALAGMLEPAAEVSLWISEQLPGMMMAADVTHVLRARGFWPSYNVPYFPAIFNASGYPAMVAKFGAQYSYDECPRALIFARNATRVRTLDELGALMRFNAWQTDALSLRSPANAVASRFDLLSADAGGMPMGAIDAKTVDRGLFSGRSGTGAKTSAGTSTRGSAGGNYRLVSGPTSDQQTPFAWSTCPFGAQWPHIGQPDRFDFAWTDADGVLG